MNKNWIKRSTAVILSTLMLASGAAVTQAGAETTETTPVSLSQLATSAAASTKFIDGKKKVVLKGKEDTAEEDNATGYYDPNGKDKSIKKIKSVNDYMKVASKNGNLKIASAGDSVSASLPTSVDNSLSKYFPEVKDQGEVGSCATWSSIYYQMSYTVNKQLKRTSTYANSMSPLWVYNAANDANPYEGLCMLDVERIGKNLGVPTMAKYGNVRDSVNWTGSEAAGIEAQSYKIKAIESLEVTDTVTSPTCGSLDVVKAALANGEVLTAITDISGYNNCNILTDTKATGNQKYAGQQIVPNSNQHQIGVEGWHAVTIVGYDDSIWYDLNGDGKVQAAEKGAFKMVNSWGKFYGTSGFTWISYDALNAKSAAGANADKARLDGRPIILGFFRMDVSTKAAADSGVYLEFDMTSQSRYDNKVVITATRNGTKKTYSMEPFATKNESDTIATIKAKKTFVCDLNNVVPDITASTINDYKWTVKFTDNKDNGKSTTVSNIRIVDKKNKTEYKSTTSSKTINNSSFTASFTTTATTRAAVKSAKTPVKIVNFQSNGKTAKLGKTAYSVNFSLENGVGNAQNTKINIDFLRNGTAYYLYETEAHYLENGTNNYAFTDEAFYEPGHYDVVLDVYDSNGNSASYTDSFDIAAAGSKCELYYSGVANPTVYYSTDGGKTFSSLKMTSNTKYASTQYYANLGAITGTAKVYFVNSSSTSVKDNRFGTYYTVSNGKYMVKNGDAVLADSKADSYTLKINSAKLELAEREDYKATKRVAKNTGIGFDVTLADSKSTKLFLETGYTLSNGTKIKNSSLVYKNCENSKNLWSTVTINTIGKVKPYVTITDIYGKTATHTFGQIEVYNTAVDKFKYSPTGDVNKGSKVTFNWKTYLADEDYSETGNKDLAKLVITKDDKTYIKKSFAIKGKGSRSYAWTPSEAGTYTAKLTAYSRFGTEASKTLKINVVGSLSATLTTFAPAQVTTAETVSLTTNIADGYPAYKCQYGYIKDGMTVYATSMNSCEATNYWSTKLSEPGVYTLFVDVQDSKGTTVRAALASNITVVKAVPLVGTFRAITNTNTLNTAQNYCVEASATGGKAPYNFRFGYIRNGVKSFDRALQCSSSTSYNYLFPGADTYTPIVEITDANGTTVTKQLSNVMVKSASSNLVTIYYNGYSTPYIHYGINGTWTAVPGHTMCKTGDMTGYTHKYVIDLGTASSAQVCFNDGCNNWQNNNGNDYTFTAGTWSFSNGSPVRIG